MRQKSYRQTCQGTLSLSVLLLHMYMSHKLMAATFFLYLMCWIIGWECKKSPAFFPYRCVYIQREAYLILAFEHYKGTSIKECILLQRIRKRSFLQDFFSPFFSSFVNTISPHFSAFLTFFDWPFLASLLYLVRPLWQGAKEVLPSHVSFEEETEPILKRKNHMFYWTFFPGKFLVVKDCQNVKSDGIN